MRVIFLDFDGVLLNRESYLAASGLSSPGAKSCIDALNKIVDETGALIVVSSTWRLGHSIMELSELLTKWGSHGKVLDKTPFAGRYNEKRGNEIQQWLDTYSAARELPESFVILDDDADMEHLMHRLVQTNVELGLTDEHAARAIAMLKGEL